MVDERQKLGAPSWNSVPLIRQFRVITPDAPVHLVLPGDISCPVGFAEEVLEAVQATHTVPRQLLSSNGGRP
jgi:hypothetical protein